MNRNKLLCLTLPLLLPGCQAPISSTGAPGGDAAGLAAGILRSVAPRPATVPAGTEAGATPTEAGATPTVESTFTAPEARGAVIANEPAAVAPLPADFGGLTLQIRWPERAAARRAQFIPATANALWIQVYRGKLGARSSVAAPAGTPVASRVVGRGAGDTVPGTGQQCCYDQSKQTVYLSLPPGDVTVWVGSFAEQPGDVVAGSTFLSAGQVEARVDPGKIAAARSLVLGANPALSPTVSAVTPAYVGPGASIAVSGTNFSAEDLKAFLYHPAPADCPGCGPTTVELAIDQSSVSGTSLRATVPSTLNNSRQYQIQVVSAGFSGIGGTVGILDRNNPLGLAIDAATVRAYYPPAGGSEWATARGARISVSKLTGIVQPNWQEPLSLPLSLVSVKDPGGSPVALDASGSFVAGAGGRYTVAGSSGEARGTAFVSAFEVLFSAITATCDNCTWDGAVQARIARNLNLIRPDCDGCSFAVPGKLYLVTKNAGFVDGDNPVSGTSALVTGDFTWTSTSPLALDAGNRTVEPGAADAGDHELEATLKMQPGVLATTSVTVFKPESVKLTRSGDCSWLNCTADLTARLVFTSPTTLDNYKMGRNSDFRWTVAPTTEGASASVEETAWGSLQFKALATGSVTVTAELIKNPAFKSTLSFAIN